MGEQRRDVEAKVLQQIWDDFAPVRAARFLNASSRGLPYFLARSVIGTEPRELLLNRRHGVH